MKQVPLILLLLVHSVALALAQGETDSSSAKGFSDFLDRLDALARELGKPSTPEETAPLERNPNPFATTLKKRFGNPELATEFAHRRAEMIRGFSDVAYLQPEVVVAMASVPMELFCPNASVENIYLDQKRYIVP